MKGAVFDNGADKAMVFCMLSIDEQYNTIERCQRCTREHPTFTFEMLTPTQIFLPRAVKRDSPKHESIWDQHLKSRQSSSPKKEDQ